MPIRCAHRCCQCHPFSRRAINLRAAQAAGRADSDMDDAEPRPSRERKAPERIEVDANITSRATGQRWSAHSCCPNHMDADPSTSEPAPKPKFTGPMDKYLGDKRVEAAVNRAVKSITDNPADLERELRDFAQTAEGWRQKSMSLEQENDAIQNKLDKVTKELEKVKKRPHGRSATLTMPKTTRPSSRRSSATAMRMTKAAGACYACSRLPSLRRSRQRPRATCRPAAGSPAPRARLPGPAGNRRRRRLGLGRRHWHPLSPGQPASEATPVPRMASRAT